MGLIKAAVSAASSVLADQWKDYFYCDSLDAGTIVVKGRKKTPPSLLGKSHDSSNVITKGSTISVADGQCAIVVEQGKVVEVAAEAGDYMYDSDLEPSVFEGTLGAGIKASFAKVGQRFTYGGVAPTDQRVYYFNTKEITGNKFGTSSPVPFRVVDRNIRLDMDISIRCNGEYSYKLIDPLLFYVNVCGNVEEPFTRAMIDSTLRAELLTSLQPAFARISSLGIRYSELPGHTLELSNALNEVLSQKWSGLRGIAVASVAINSITASQEDEAMIKQLQRSAMLRDPNMAAATLVDAQSQAMREAAANSGGAVLGFAGLNQASQAGGLNAQTLFEMGGRQNAQGPSDSWKCVCGEVNTAKFCPNCGRPRPENAGTFVCSKCGYTAPNGSKPPKFCPECGNPVL